MLQGSSPIPLIADLDKLSIKSAGKKYLEVLVRVFDDWASTDDDFRYNYECHKVVSRSNFFNLFHSFLSSSIGESSIPSTILTSEDRLKQIPRIETLFSLYESALSRINQTSNLEENQFMVKCELVDEIFAYYFKDCGKNEGFKYLNEVIILDEWISGIISEVIAASVFGVGAPEDSEHRLFYIMLEDKETHTAAAFLIGAILIESWLNLETVRNDVGLGISRDIFGEVE